MNKYYSLSVLYQFKNSLNLHLHPKISFTSSQTQTSFKHRRKTFPPAFSVWKLHQTCFCYLPSKQFCNSLIQRGDHKKCLDECLSDKKMVEWGSVCVFRRKKVHHRIFNRKQDLLNWLEIICFWWSERDGKLCLENQREKAFINFLEGIKSFNEQKKAVPRFY